MEQDRNNATPGEDRHDLYTDEKTREKIRKHWSDPTDRITEEDIRNVNTDIYERPETEAEKDELDEKADDITPPKAPSPWDLKSED